MGVSPVDLEQMAGGWRWAWAYVNETCINTAELKTGAWLRCCRFGGREANENERSPPTGTDPR